MYVIPYSMGPVGSPFSKIGFEITDSIYVVLSMNIMTRVGQDVLDALGDSNDFVRGVHGKCTLDINKGTFSIFPKTILYGHATPVTEAMFSWAKNASPSALHHIKAGWKAGWLNTCS